MFTSNAQATHNSGEPAVTAVIEKDGLGRPSKYRGYATNFSKLRTNYITYTGNRMTFTDSADGFKRLEVLFNACGQPDSTSWFQPVDGTWEYAANLKFRYNSGRELTGFIAYVPVSHGIIPFETNILRDGYGNVTGIDDGGAHGTYITYDYTKPNPDLRWSRITASFPEWAAVTILDQMGMINFKTSHLPKTLQEWQGDYKFEDIYFENFVINGGKVSSYDVRRNAPGSPDHGAFQYTITAAWTCSNAWPHGK
ncbi:hypothetical protein [Chitinophaga caseinilytica]|uniref:hypothetical protein n=1 Tax=Chitinophaga caseinilytica TaxID=2267521 RepID=UPI003C2CAD67